MSINELILKLWDRDWKFNHNFGYKSNN